MSARKINKYKPRIKKEAPTLFICKSMVFTNFPFLVTGYGDSVKSCYQDYVRVKTELTKNWVDKGGVVG